MNMKEHLRPSLVLLVMFTLATGLAYPALVTSIAQLLMPAQANGSLVMRDGKAAGSKLIGQSFADPKHFWSRPSATSPYPYNAASSSGSNQGPTNPALLEAVAGRIKALQDADPGNKRPVPVDLVTASASGLDPHISPAAAEYQVERVARARNLPAAKVRDLVAKHTENRQLGFLGEPRVNVLELNLDLDALH
jgi:potassium-transporting ATPase KdpC subunit